MTIEKMVATAHRPNQLDSFTSVLLDSIGDGVVVYDPQLRYVVFNRFMEQITGVRAEDAIGRCALELFPHLTARGVDVLIARALAGESVRSPEIPFEVPTTGRSGWIIGQYSPMLNDSGDCVGAVGIIRDITERKRAEDTLRHSESWYRSLTENALEMICVLYADGSTKYVSPSLERFLGLTQPQALAVSLFSPVHPDDLPLVQLEFERALEQRGDPLHVQFRYRRADGAWRTLVAVARSLLDDPAVRGIVVNCRDVTDQRDLELQLQHAQKLDAIGRIAGAVAHDFNNLLTVVQGNAALALADIADGQPGRAELEEIGDAATRAAALTRQLLTFSRQQSLNIEDVCANQVVEGMRRLLARVVAENQELRFDLDTAVGSVRVDRGQIEQVLMNLIANARDAMPHGGTVTISTHDAELPPEHARFRPGMSPGMFVRLAVSDTGVGMEADVQSRIFEPFFTTKDRSKGTGLGLPTAYGIVQRSGGFMAVHSEPGNGSTFEIYLPRV